MAKKEKELYYGNDGKTWWRGVEKTDGTTHIYFGTVGENESQGRKHGHIVYDEDGSTPYGRLSNGERINSSSK